MRIILYLNVGGGLPPMCGDEQQQQQDYEKEQEQEEVLGDDALTVNVFNFPNTFYLKLERTKSFKYEKDEIVNEQS